MRLIDVGGRLVELEIRRSNRVRGSRIVVRPGYPPELVVRPRAGEAEVDAALNEHLPWLERQLARTPEAAPRPRPAAADRGAGPARGSGSDRADRRGRSRRARRRVPANHAPRPAQQVGVVLGERHALVQLAARAGSPRRPRLRRRARGLPPRRAQPRRALLEARRAAPARRTASPRNGCTSTAGRSSPTGRPGTPRPPRRLEPVERWATFDCYGTLIDWDGGVRAELVQRLRRSERPTRSWPATTRSRSRSSATARSRTARC